MKEQIKETDIKKFDRYGNIYTILLLAMIISPIPLVRYLHVMGIVIWAVLAVITLFVANRVEKVKKELDIQTYREIVAFMNGEKLDEIEKQKERKKLRTQRIGLVIGGGVVALVVCMVMAVLLY